MQTSRIISNISYNTLLYFKMKIEELLQNSIIDWAYWILHLPDEDDEKEHIHFVLKPAKRIDTADLRTHFNEFDDSNPLPLTCTMRWYATNKMDDWLLYAIHHPAYLASKGQYRKNTYEWKDIQSTDIHALKYDIANIDMRKYFLLQWLEDAVRSGVPFFELVQQGLIPIAQRSQYEYQYHALSSAIHREETKKREERGLHKKLHYVQDSIPSPFDEEKKPS